MSTVLSWTELRASVTDLRALLAFRRASTPPQGRRRMRVALGIVAALTVLVVCVPAYSGDLISRENTGNVLALLPTACLGLLMLSIMSSMASGGGRELVPRDQAVVFPVSTTTDHWGALLMAPLNIAWLLQAWTLLGATAYAFGPRLVPLYLLPMLLWILCSTAVAQVVGWVVEGVRRGRHGIVVVRGTLGVVAAGAAVMVATHRVAPMLDRLPLKRLVFDDLAVLGGHWWSWARVVVVLLVLLAAAMLAGAAGARWALLRPMREELRLESGRHQPRSLARSDLAMMLRIDRASVWRSVPLRRGIFVLAAMPGLVALSGHLEWRMLTVLPGLVASGAALLFGVNAWCLDGRGALWRENLPVSPRLGFLSRVIVLAELLLGSALVTLVLASLRAGTPTRGEVAALICATVVVAVQVVGAAMRWSVSRPFSVDLRGARATPAPPVVMAGYSTRLALVTTFSGLVFSGLSNAAQAWPSFVVALPMLLWSSYRLARTERRWSEPTTRARVVVTVAG